MPAAARKRNRGLAQRCRDSGIVRIRDQQDVDPSLRHRCGNALDLEGRGELVHREKPAVSAEQRDGAADTGAVIVSIGGILRDGGGHEASVRKCCCVGDGEGHSLRPAER